MRLSLVLIFLILATGCSSLFGFKSPHSYEDDAGSSTDAHVTDAPVAPPDARVTDGPVRIADAARTADAPTTIADATRTDAPVIDARIVDASPAIDAPPAIDASADAPPAIDADLCGDGIVEPNETCDPNDPGSIDLAAGATACPYGTPSCKRCNADCTETSLTGPFCGDGTTDSAFGEACDDANSSNQDDCLNTCKANVCGDGFVDKNGTKTEQCDLGPGNGAQFCPYGTPTCSGCTTLCKTDSLTGPYCGDGNKDGADGEQCDLGAANGTNPCAYNTQCLACSSGCQAVTLSGGSCGDGVVQAPNEVCDDGNTDSCGTCSADCQTAQPYVGATGTISTVNGTSQPDHQTFTLSDGTNSLSFELYSGGVQVGDVTVGFTTAQSATTIASDIATAVNGCTCPASCGKNLVCLAISATSSTNHVSLTNAYAGSYGDVPINTSGGGFTVNGMSGAGGGDCPIGTTCANDVDCCNSPSCGSSSTTLCSAGVCTGY